MYISYHIPHTPSSNPSTKHHILSLPIDSEPGQHPHEIYIPPSLVSAKAILYNYTAPIRKKERKKKKKVLVVGQSDRMVGYFYFIAMQPFP